MTYCVIPRALAGRLYMPLRRRFAGERSIEVVVERREKDRRAAGDRRVAAPAVDADQRRIRNLDGRRVAEQRLPFVEVAAPSLPKRLRRYADRLVFLQRLEPSEQSVEDVDTARVVARFQGGDESAFAVLYMRYFDRVYTYMAVTLDDSHTAEDATQQIFTKVFTALPRYEIRPRHPFRAWLFTIVRNHAITLRRREVPVELVDPGRFEDEPASSNDPVALDWIMDRELMMFVDRLPAPQREVLVMRYVLDLSHAQIADAMGLNVSHVRVLQTRALGFLRKRLEAVGRGPSRGSKRSGWCRRYREAPVLRQRRFALSP